MTHRYFITDGTTEIELTAGDYITRDWTPNAPRLNLDAQSVYDLESYANVSEEFEVRIHEAVDKPTVQENIRAIERLILVAQNRLINEFGPKVYLQAIIDGSAERWQSQIVGGSVGINGSALRDWANQGANVTVAFERLYYWELTTDTALTLTSSTGTGTARTITNTHDDNWVRFSGVDGSLPTPLKIQMQNLSTAMLGTHSLYLSNNVFNDPTGFDPYLTDADLDDGVANQSWASSTHDLLNPKWAWDIPSATLADCAGGWFRILAVFSALAPQMYVKANLYVTISGVNTLIYEGDEIYTGDDVFDTIDLMDLGSLPLPPGEMPNANSVRVGLTVRSSGAGNGTMDFIQIMPTTSYRKLYKPGHSWAQTGVIIDNGIDDTAYMGVDSSRIPVVFKYHTPIYAWPQRDNRIDLLYSSGTGVPSNSTSMQIWARPRRATL